ncbi:hypothetical protein NUU61_001089 [Penicillium alfredii]|uniref:Carboxylesterase type B domain-containing protein n=1 Tax=Penicillium alfredii TaxID=1506179 RepID=A0A9W9GAT5_9EURO|nr:uncharacterized protein NUU61_001089 [Penicillium alfredii]KAJ5115330.1 hypothetical protein NUU61_001089 [Penicillium alfredii]
MHPISLLYTALLLLVTTTTAATFPAINLDTATHRPTSTNTTVSGLTITLYNNIRFAQPPTGPRRFRKPQTPPPHQSGIQDGRHRLFSSDCVSTAPASVPFPELNGTTWGQEDCLFLNVWVPEGVRPGDGVPVVHWLYGSAMGLYGWASSTHEDMDANVGLHDGLAALRWTRKYISRFGGNPDDITAMGESAGAAMITLMLVAEEGKIFLPFQKAFISSPAMLPRRNVTTRRENVYKQVLKSANCTSLDCLRHTSPRTLAAANKHLLSDMPSGSGGGTFGPGIGLGPFPDGEYITDASMVLFRHGKFNPQVRAVIVGNTADEGLATTPDIRSPAEFAKLVRMALPGANDSSVQTIREMYPYPDSWIDRVAQDWTTDSTHACNARAIARAYAEKAQRYVFSVPPATHFLDINYFFFKDNTSTPVVNVSLAHQFQSELLSFLHQPAGKGSAKWPLYGDTAKTANVTANGLPTTKDPWATRPKCEKILRIIEDTATGA